MVSLVISAQEHVRRLHSPRFSCSLYQLATCRRLLCGATDGYISHVCELGCLTLLMGPPGKGISGGCRWSLTAGCLQLNTHYGVLLNPPPISKKVTHSVAQTFCLWLQHIFMHLTVWHSCPISCDCCYRSVFSCQQKVWKETELNFCKHPMHARKCFLHVLNVHAQIQQPCLVGTWPKAKGGSSILAWC